MAGILREIPPVSFAKREWRGAYDLRIAIDWTKRGREALILVGIALFLAFVRPYGGTGGSPFLLNFLVWLILIVSGTAVGELTVWAYYKWRPQGPAWLMIVLTSLVTAAGVTGVIYALKALSGGYILVGNAPVHILYFYVLVIATAMTLLGYTLGRAFNVAGPDFVHRVDDRDAVAAFLERLPVKYRTAELWAVSSEDHYCRVHTSLGSDLILMRLSDAERELGSVDGLRVHRSWWVSRIGIQGARREGGRIVLVLKNEAEVPVSRSYQDTVKHAGLAP
ncbi:LytTR family DNA-binding domain-containing protein [Henriciella aquimarina]|uniref:LytTR family DNA-binding domain-containing protein n=1 Tax=Henriciella aquimarina TaxID=545261 RepID=UPI001302038A|nr:LytTR family DNA-binding domain-containing protein [Henriciella aquimarina]